MILRKTKANSGVRLNVFKQIAFATITALALGSWMPNRVSATLIAEVEPNDTGATAQNNLNGFFSLDFNADIGDSSNNNTSTTIAHVSIIGTGDGTYDFYRFTSLGGTLILDIDSTIQPDVGNDGDTVIGLFDSLGNFMLINDDSAFFDTGSVAGASGWCATHNCNSFIETAVAPGDYIVAICGFGCGFGNGFSISGPTLQREGYTLHISTPHYVGNSTGDSSGSVPAPEPSTMLLLGSGLAGLGAYRRHRNAQKN